MSKTSRDIILDCCEGSRYATKFFKNLSDEAYIGYQTAMIKAHHPNLNINVSKLFFLIKEMLKNGEL